MNDYPVGFTTIPIFFTTHSAAGSPVAPLSAFEAADVKLFKNGSDVERTSTSGWTMTSPFNSHTGLHRLLIDSTDNTDAGFYSAGAVYDAVLVPDETVDGLAVIKWIGAFSLGMHLMPTTPGRTLTVESDGMAHADVKEINGIAAAAVIQAYLAQGGVSGTAITGTLSSTQMTTDLTEATDDHYNGKTPIWITGALAGMIASGPVSDYNGTSKLLTFGATPTGESPANGDRFILV